MKILFTGGGTGGHFYPIIAVAEAVHKIAEEQRYVGIELYFMSNEPYDKRALFENQITFLRANAGRARIYFTLRNVLDYFKTAFGLVSAFWQLYALFPDVIFAKGGYASFPALFAARLLGIPVVIHESDSVPGRVNQWAGKFARNVAVSYPEASNYFSKEKVAVTGNPIREDLVQPQSSGARQFFELETGVPVIYVTGGSAGARNINEVVVDLLPKLVENAIVIHQTGKAHFQENSERARLLLDTSAYKQRYKPFEYLDVSGLRMVAGVANLIISRAGSSIFEIAAWATPAILIPIPSENSHSDHQRKNAYAYARSGAALVMEEKNLTPHILLSEINRILGSLAIQEEMRLGAKKFFNPGAARTIAQTLLSIGLEHEQ